jgi:hypothetical protein
MSLRLLIAIAFIFGLVAACTQQPPGADLGPLPACRSERFAREALPPAGSQKISLILLAVQEWIWFGGQEIDFRGPSPQLRRAGVREDGTIGSMIRTEAPQRVAAYWRAAGYTDRNGLDRIAWSAAFISWLFVNAGVPASVFCPDQGHAIYVERLVAGARLPDAQLVPKRVSERVPQPGDLICASREGSGLTLDNLNRGPGHCDLVVERRPDAVVAIGGNVADSVTRSIFPLDPAGHLVPTSARPFFTVIENDLP